MCAFSFFPSLLKLDAGVPQSQVPKQTNIKTTFGDIAMTFEFYYWYFWCKRCGRWIPRETAVSDVNGNPVCPICKKRLRTKPSCSYRNRKAKNNHKEPISTNDATSKQTLLLELPSRVGSNLNASSFPPKGNVAKSMILQASSDFLGNPLNCNVKRKRNMEA